MERADCGCPLGADGDPIHVPGCTETIDVDEDAFSHWEENEECS